VSGAAGRAVSHLPAPRLRRARPRARPRLRQARPRARQTPRARRTLGFSFYAELQAQMGSAVNGTRTGTTGGPVQVLEKGVGRFVDAFPDVLRWVPMAVIEMRAQEKAEQAKM